MKNQYSFRWSKAFLKAIAISGSCCALALSAQNLLMPVVTVGASDPKGSWSGDPAQFRFFRDGPTNASLNVYYLVGGTATNGVDYKLIGNWITIPAGVRASYLPIIPINNGQTDTRTVGVQLAPSPMATLINYVIGSPSNAVVSISTNSTITNPPPLVRIASPPNGAVYPFSPTNIWVNAQATDLNGYVSTVEFFANGTSLGIRTNNPLSMSAINPFMLMWSNVTAGAYTLRALARDNLGASTLSDPVNIFVGTNSFTNLPPVVRIVSPPNNATFPGPLDLPIYAYARNVSPIATVQFFDGTTSLGFGTNVGVRFITTVAASPTNLYSLVWSNAPTGSHTLRALATDIAGRTATSEPVNVFIFAPPPPPPPSTNPPIVSIVAVDPIAIEGTNCWPWLGMTTNTMTPFAWSSWAGGTAICRYFTNCGPKNAAFAVRRTGPTNAALTVQYAIAGTATNGVDYLPLSGQITIPAGARRSLIPIVPIDDGPPDLNSTVVLKLLPSTDTPPGYMIGYPRVAAALIVDSLNPQPVTSLLAGHLFHLRAAGPDGSWFHVEYSTNMMDWTPICTNQVVNGSIDFIDPEASTNGLRLYRTIPETTAPAQ